MVAHIKDKENFFKRILALLICLTVFATSLMSFGIYQNKQSVIPVDSEKAIGMTHFLMMGLCQEKDGVYSGDDVAFSEGIEDASERSAENLSSKRTTLRNGYRRIYTSSRPKNACHLWRRNVCIRC